MAMVEVFFIRKSYKTYENTVHIFQSLPVGQIGVFPGLILAPGTYVWHPCFRLFSCLGPRTRQPGCCWLRSLRWKSWCTKTHDHILCICRCNMFVLTGLPLWGSWLVSGIHARQEFFNVSIEEKLQLSPFKGRMHPAQFSVFESSSDLSYCDSLSQHRHLLAGKRLFLPHKTFLVQGKKCWTIVVPNVFFITTWQIIVCQNSWC